MSQNLVKVGLVQQQNELYSMTRRGAVVDPDSEVFQSQRPVPVERIPQP